MSDVKEKIKKVELIIFVFISFCLFLTPSFGPSNTLDYTSLTKEQLTSLQLNENYTSVVIELPSLVYKPEKWNEKFTNVKAGKSLSKIAEKFNGFVYINNAEYAHSKILVPNKNYKRLVKELTSLGFTVRNNTYGKLLISDSRSSIGLPYYYYDSGVTELTGKNRKIAIIDSGIDDTHDDFPGTYPSYIDKIIYWHDSSGGAWEYPDDRNGHGTLVASIAAGTGDASDGKYKGVAPDAQLMIWKVTIGSSFIFDWDYLTHALNDAIAQHPDVISLSLASLLLNRSDYCDGTTTETDVKAVYDAINNAISNNIPVVVAAGNSGPSPQTISFPACIDGVIAVGSTLKKYYLYGIYEENTDWPHSETAEVHVEVISNGVTILDKEWEAPTSYTGEASGFQYVFRPTSFPATIEVKIEGEHRLRRCWLGECSNPECIWWEPGTNEKGDEFWEDEDWSETFNSGPYIGVDVYVQPRSKGGMCPLPWDVGWWDKYFEIYNYPNYVKIYRTSSSTTEGLVYYTSSRGPSPQGIVKPDVTAPGHNICGAKSWKFAYEDCMSCDDEDYICCSGTSFAAPHVAGMIALLMEAKPTASYSEILDSIKKTDERILPDNPDNTEGHGRISVTKGVDFITDCNVKLSYDTDSGDRPLTKGGCFDYTTWSEDHCSGVFYDEYCNGTYVYEYITDGSTCIGHWRNCQDLYGSIYTCQSGRCTSGGGGWGGGGGGRHRK